MANASDWLGLAEENMSAARAVRGEFFRSAVSRAYYAAYSAAHAVLIHLGESPPERGNWSHEVLPQALTATLHRGQGSTRPYNVLRQRLVSCYNLRIEADYGVTAELSGESAERACRAAGQIVAFANRVLGDSNAA